MTTLSIIIPTYNEGGNVNTLVHRLNLALPTQDVEILFVDDSTDDTPDRIVNIQTLGWSRIPVHMHHRPHGMRDGGLSGAVKLGFELVTGKWVLVMDGDLQHPPEVIPSMLNTGTGRAADIVVASRYMAGGSAGGLATGSRRLVSTASTMLARLMFPRKLRDVTDPMTGFFMVRRDAINVESLQPSGFKILLEILGRHNLDVVEVPFTFGQRIAGTSKADMKNGLAFLRQLITLRTGRGLPFALVGLTGVVVNLSVMAILHSSINYLLASVVATEVAIAWNFLLLERLVFKDHLTGRLVHRAARFTGFNNVEVLVRTPLLWLAVAVVGFNDLLSQAGLLVLAFVARYLFTTRVVYRTHKKHVILPVPVPAAVPVPEVEVA